MTGSGPNSSMKHAGSTSRGRFRMGQEGWGKLLPILRIAARSSINERRPAPRASSPKRGPSARAARLPLVIDLVRHRHLLVRRHLDREDDRAAVDLLVVVALLQQVPLAAAVELLQHLDRHVFLLVVAHLDLEALDHLAVVDLLEGRLLALADDVEGVA